MKSLSAVCAPRYDAHRSGIFHTTPTVVRVIGKKSKACARTLGGAKEEKNASQSVSWLAGLPLTVGEEGGNA